MVISRALDRMKYGSLVHKGNFEDHVSEYEDIVRGLDGVDVNVYERFDPVPDSGNFLTSSGLKTEANEQDVSGDEAWEFANNTLEEFMPNSSSIDEVPFYFEHRSRRDTHNIRMGVSGRSTLGSRRDYLVNFNGHE